MGASREPGRARLATPERLPQPVLVLTHEDLRRSPRVQSLMRWLAQIAEEDADAPVGRGFRPRRGEGQG